MSLTGAAQIKCGYPANQAGSRVDRASLGPIWERSGERLWWIKSARQRAALVLGRSSSALRHTLGGRRRRSGHGWLGKAALGAGGRFARRRWDGTGGRGTVLWQRDCSGQAPEPHLLCCSSRQRRSWGSVAVRSRSVAPRVFVRRLALGSQHAHVDVTRRRVFAPYAGRNARACAALQRNAASSAWRGPILTKTST
jgi:hypothetical protein